MFENSQTRPHISSKVRAYGKARIDIAKRATTPEDWEKMWKPPQNRFPFTWGKYWKQCIEYRVDDFTSEVGFFIDMLGLPVIAFDPNYAMFTSPAGEFTFAVVQAPEGGYSTPSDAIRIQFMVEDILSTSEELVRRGIVFTQNPEPLSEGSLMYVATFQTPHGICIDVWGEVKQASLEVVENEAAEEVESQPEVEKEEELDEQQDQPAPKSPSIADVDVDDLFEEIHDEPIGKPVFDNKPKIKPEVGDKEDSEEGSQEEVQYIDEPEANYPVYKPIPLRK